MLDNRFIDATDCEMLAFYNNHLFKNIECVSNSKVVNEVPIRVQHNKDSNNLEFVMESGNRYDCKNTLIF